MPTVPKLQFAACFLSLLVMLQAVLITEKIFLHSTYVPKDELVPSIDFIDKLTMSSSQSLVNRSQEGKAQVWLEQKPSELTSENTKVTIWLETNEEVEVVDLKIRFSAKSIKLIDKVNEIPGVQIGLEDDIVYLQNQADQDNGLISLSARLTTGFNGKIALGEIEFIKIDSQSSFLEFEFVPGSREGSFVGKTGSFVNLLSQPKSLEI